MNIKQACDRLHELADPTVDWDRMGLVKPKPEALLHATLWVYRHVVCGPVAAPDAITLGNCGEVFVEWDGPRHQEFDGTNPDGDYWEAAKRLNISGRPARRPSPPKSRPQSSEPSRHCGCTAGHRVCSRVTGNRKR